MVERIKTLLEARQLSPTQFADAIGIARPIMSHILSGRNKPSLEVVQRIIAAFPDLSLSWLLSGFGPMKDVAAVEPAAAAGAHPEPVSGPPLPVEPKRVRSAAVTSVLAYPAAQQAASSAVDAGLAALPPAAVTPEAAPAPAAPASVVPLPPRASRPPSAPEAESLALATALSEPGKAIRRIVIFYHDGTFTAYQPE